MNHLIDPIRAEIASYEAVIERLNKAIRALEDSDTIPAATFTSEDARAMEDRIAKVRAKYPKPKARTRTGIRAKLTADDIETIRMNVEDGIDHTTVGEQFGISRSTVSNIVRRQGCYA